MLLDLHLAAAEHYMFSRFLVCTATVSSTQMKALTIGYDAKKLLSGLFGRGNSMAVTSNPVSPVSRHVTRWGLRGATDGEADRLRCNSGTSAPVWRPVNEIFNVGYIGRAGTSYSR
jgi:hypothetical protein